MIEYGIRDITTNPTLITKSTEIIKLVDNRTQKIRAYVLPPSYEPYIKKIEKEIENKKWVEEKKRLLQESQQGELDNLNDFSEAGKESINKYLENS